jgi:endoribonuclease Dicer
VLLESLQGPHSSWYGTSGVNPCHELTSNESQTNSVALAEQQHQMLCENLPTLPALVHGSTMDTWRQQEWHDLFNASEAVVCTAAILYECLNHAYIKIQDINLIIFDEAHHAKKQHPYAK